MAVEDHTEGRQVHAYTRAYLAGLIDGDGSIMLQLKPRTNSKFGIRVKTTLVIYQDSKMIKEMEWLQQELGAGYIYERNDHIIEIRIEGHQRVKETLAILKPYIRFKKKQVTLILKAIKILQHGINFKKDLLLVADLADQIASCNYKSSTRKYTKEYVMQHVSP